MSVSIICKYLYIQNYMPYKPAQQTGKASTPSLPTCTLLSVFTQKIKRKKQKEATNSCPDWEHLEQTDVCLIFKYASFAMLVIIQLAQ